MAQDYSKDKRAQYLNEQEKQRFAKIRDPRTKETVLDIGEFLHTHNTTKQYISVSDFRKYIPLYSKEQGEKFIKTHSQADYTDLSTEFWKKFNLYKEILVVKSYSNKEDIVAVLPAAAVASPSIELTEEQEKNTVLDKAKRDAGNVLRPDIMAKGQKEYYNYLLSSQKTDMAVRHFATERVKAEAAVRRLDSIRQAEIDRRIANYKQSHPETNIQSGSTPDSKFEISDDEELFE